MAEAGKLTGQPWLSLDYWPRLLQPLVEKHGGKVVQDAGLCVLGYPPAWAHTYKEIMAVQQSIEKGG